MALPVHATLGQRLWHHAFRLLCVLVFIFLLAPIIIIIPISFSSSSLLNYPLPGLSLRWFEVPTMIPLNSTLSLLNIE